MHTITLRRANPDADRLLIAAADKLGDSAKLCCSTLPPERPMTHEGCVASNSWTLRRHEAASPGACSATAPSTPAMARLRSTKRAARVEDRGFIGIKLYNDYRADEPVVFPVVELAIRLKVPILQHAGHTMWLLVPAAAHQRRARTSAPWRRAIPEALLICAHICGGGDWEWTIKSLRAAPVRSILDTSGSVIDDGVVDMAVRELGAERGSCSPAIFP
jgi:hypothetical protein